MTDDLEFPDPIPTGPPHRRGVKLLADLMQSLSEMPEVATGGAQEAQCRFCGVAYSHHFGRRSERHFFRHPGSAPILFSIACRMTGRSFWGADEVSARNAINR